MVEAGGSGLALKLLGGEAGWPGGGGGVDLGRAACSAASWGQKHQTPAGVAARAALLNLPFLLAFPSGCWGCRLASLCSLGCLAEDWVLEDSCDFCRNGFMPRGDVYSSCRRIELVTK